MSVFNDTELAAIKSMGLYWREVAEREHGGNILREEFSRLYNKMGMKLLWAVLDYAEGQKINADLLAACKAALAEHPAEGGKGIDLPQSLLAQLNTAVAKAGGKATEIECNCEVGGVPHRNCPVCRGTGFRKAGGKP
jgi:hypothetical protein